MSIVDRLINILLRYVDFEQVLRKLLERLNLPEEFIELILDIVADLFAEAEQAGTVTRASKYGILKEELVASLRKRASK